uniref:Uncharacterized protein n=1 Tax=Arundo donax TaxID=35708 RepID=A0A0A9FVM8_ARUDO
MWNAHPEALLSYLLAFALLSKLYIPNSFVAHCFLICSRGLIFVT